MLNYITRGAHSPHGSSSAFVIWIREEKKAVLFFISFYPRRQVIEAKFSSSQIDAFFISFACSNYGLIDAYYYFCHFQVITLT